MIVFPVSVGTGVVDVSGNIQVVVLKAASGRRFQRIKTSLLQQGVEGVSV